MSSFSANRPVLAKYSENHFKYCSLFFYFLANQIKHKTFLLLSFPNVSKPNLITRLDLLWNFSHTIVLYKHKISINEPHPGFSANLTWPDPLEVRKLLWSFCLSLQYSLAFENKKKNSENNSYQTYICRNYFICTWHTKNIKFSVSTIKVNFEEQN